MESFIEKSKTETTVEFRRVPEEKVVLYFCGFELSVIKHGSPNASGEEVSSAMGS